MTQMDFKLIEKLRNLSNNTTAEIRLSVHQERDELMRVRVSLANFEKNKAYAVSKLLVTDDTDTEDTKNKFVYIMIMDMLDRVCTAYATDSKTGLIEIKRGASWTGKMKLMLNALFAYIGEKLALKGK